MPIFITPTDQLFAVPTIEHEGKVRKELGVHLYSKFGTGPFDSETTNQAQHEAIEWYVAELSKRLGSEKEAAFYQGLFWLHEMALKQSRENPNQSPTPQFTDFDFSLYSRTLRLFLEFACDLDLLGKETLSREYLKYKEDTIDHILVLGQEFIRVSNGLNMNKMVPWCIELRSEDEALHFFQDEYCQRLTNVVQHDFQDHRSITTVSDKDLSRLRAAVIESFNVDIVQFWATVTAIKKSHVGGNLAGYQWDIFPDFYAESNSGDLDLARQFFKGLTLTRANKLSLADSIYKTSSLNRLIYRPVLTWNVNRLDIVFVGDEALLSAFMKLAVDAVGWKKCPNEWSLPSFKSWVKNEHSRNAKILENEIISRLKKHQIKYDNNVTQLRKWNNRGLNLKHDECGEIDFIFLSLGRIFLCEQST